MDSRTLKALLNHGMNGFIAASAGRGKQGMDVEEIASHKSPCHSSWRVSRLMSSIS
jgi:hypothetical protein